MSSFYAISFTLLFIAYSLKVGSSLCAEVKLVKLNGIFQTKCSEKVHNAFFQRVG